MTKWPQRPRAEGDAVCRSRRRLGTGAAVRPCAPTAHFPHKGGPSGGSCQFASCHILLGARGNARASSCSCVVDPAVRRQWPRRPDSPRLSGDPAVRRARMTKWPQRPRAEGDAVCRSRRRLGTGAAVRPCAPTAHFRPPAQRGAVGGFLSIRVLPHIVRCPWGQMRGGA